MCNENFLVVIQKSSKKKEIKICKINSFIILFLFSIYPLFPNSKDFFNHDILIYCCPKCFNHSFYFLIFSRFSNLFFPKYLNMMLIRRTIHQIQ